MIRISNSGLLINLSLIYLRLTALLFDLVIFILGQCPNFQIIQAFQALIIILKYTKAGRRSAIIEIGGNTP
jgi:hypothetical protein